MGKTWGTKARGAGCAGHLPAPLLLHLQPLASAPLCLSSWMGGRRASEMQFGSRRAWQLLLGAAGDALCLLPGAWPGFASRRKEVWGAAWLGDACQPPGTALSCHTSCSKVAQPFLQPLEGSLQRQQQRNQRSGPSEGSKKASIPPHIQAGGENNTSQRCRLCFLPSPSSALRLGLLSLILFPIRRQAQAVHLVMFRLHRGRMSSR